jgi:hypothetical protein
MKRQLLTLVSAMALLLVAGSAFGQTISLKANVPFGFIVSGKSLPAGEYAFRYDTPRSILSVRNLDSRHTTLVLVVDNGGSPRSAEQSKLVFRQYGNLYFLSQVWQAGSNDWYELSKTRREAEVAMNSVRGNATVAVNLR